METSVQIIGIVVSAIFSLATVILSVVAIVYSHKASVDSSEIASRNTFLTEENTRLSNGNMEIQVREMISQARRFLASAIQNTIMSKINPSIADDKDLQGIVENLLRDAQQDYLNAYEEACMKYIDNKVDKDRFRKTYSEEIRNIVRDENYKKYFDDFSSTYYAIKRVYEQWNNPEKN